MAKKKEQPYFRKRLSADRRTYRFTEKPGNLPHFFTHGKSPVSLQELFHTLGELLSSPSLKVPKAFRTWNILDQNGG